MTEHCDTNYNYTRLVSSLISLTKELDCELDGVKLPATAATIMNAIRRTLNEISDE